MRPLSLLIVLLALAEPAFGQKSKPFRQPIIDMHMHVYAADERWTHKVPNPVNDQPMVATTAEAHMEATIAQMNRYNVVKALISGNESDYEATLRWKGKSPERFIVGYGFDNPAKADLEFIRKEAKAGRLQAIGEIGPQYEGIAPNDPVLEPFFALAEELDLPVAIHVGLGPPGAPYVGFPKYRMSLSNALLLEEVLVRHPKLRLYVMHAGWPLLNEMIGLLYAHPQVYVDVGVINWTQPRKEFHAYLRRLVDAGYGKRIMFGSDQMVWPEAIGMAVEAINSADFLSSEQKADIFYNNAARFLRLETQDNCGAHDRRSRAVAHAKPMRYDPSMSLAEIKQAAAQLPPEELTALTAFLVERDQAAWDGQLERDAASGKLDRLFQEAESERAKGTLRDWPE